MHLHWPQEELMNMEHAERRAWVAETVRLLAEPSPTGGD
jgi:hypothetical protein